MGEPHDEEVTERGALSESTDEEDGPQARWSNPLAGRMRCYDDEESEWSADEEAPEYDPTRQVVVDNDIDFL